MFQLFLHIAITSVLSMAGMCEIFLLLNRNCKISRHLILPVPYLTDSVLFSRSTFPRSGDSPNGIARSTMTWEPMVVWYLTAPTWNICLNTDPCQSGAKFRWSWLDCKLRKLWANTSYRHIWLIVFFYFVLVVVSRKSHDVINHIFIVKIAKWRSANWSWQLGKNVVWRNASSKTETYTRWKRRKTKCLHQHQWPSKKLRSNWLRSSCISRHDTSGSATCHPNL